jgi:hypothetical protein
MATVAQASSPAPLYTYRNGGTAGDAGATKIRQIIAPCLRVQCYMLRNHIIHSTTNFTLDALPSEWKRTTL